MKENEIKNIILDYCEVGGVSDIDALVEEIKDLLIEEVIEFLFD